MSKNYRIRIPLIKIIDKACPRSSHYIGTNIHDRLYFKNKQLIYSNIQNGDSTIFDKSGYSFENGDIEMASLEKILDMQAEILDCDLEKDYLKIKQEFLSYIEKMCERKRKNDEQLLEKILKEL
ncbi:hypothetical protein ACF3OI_10185 (plasmid) [Finegoldia magna]|uniref:hypothetical protein n=1 Tax=Finegoldia magna TaxID=1260 RepID=UPI00370DE058